MTGLAKRDRAASGRAAGDGGGTLSGHRSSILVAALSSAFGVALLQVTAALEVAIRADDVTGQSATVATMLTILATVFLVIAVYVGPVVTVNTFATIVAGRARQIALLRLIGSSAVTPRRRLARQGLVVGVVGSLIGAGAGTAVAAGLVRFAVGVGWLPDLGYTWASLGLVVPVVAVTLTTWAASWIGSRRVLTVTPLQALSGSEELSRKEAVAQPIRTVAAIVLGVVGTAVLLLGVAVGTVNPIGVLIGVVGGMLSFTGLVLGAHLVMPPLLSLVGRGLGGSPSARLASENALRHPERSSRSTIGLVIGVTLVTTFGVAIATWADLIRAAQEAQPGVYEGVDGLLVAVQAVFSSLVGFSAVIAAVGLVNSLSLGVLQRTRELGLLRALGFSVGQVRRMIVAEAGQLTVTAVALGLVLGGFYGWCGAQSLLGSITGSPGLVLPSVLWPVIAVIVVGAAVLTVVASITPARRATRVSPVTALAVE